MLGSQVLLKIDSTSVTGNRPTNVTQNYFHEHHSNWFHKRYSKLVPQVLLNISSTNITQK